MKFILLALTLSFFSPLAQARKPDSVNVRARALLERLKGKIEIQATPLLRFYLSPAEPMQGQNVDLFVEAKVRFTGRTASIDAKLDGKSVSFRQPATHLWVLPLGVVTETKSHSLQVKKFMENTQDNVDLRDAIKALDNNINSLTTQINNEREAGRRKVLQAQRAEKVALKNELVDQLKKLRTKVGEESFAFKVKPAQNLPGFPAVQSIAPSTGPNTGGTEITVTGSNFTADFSANFSGIPAAETEFVSATELKVTTPSFQMARDAIGAKNLELRFESASGVKNVILENAFYATDAGTIPPTFPLKPVAVATSGQEILLGQSAGLDGTLSYDPNGDAITYEWKTLSTPAGSNYSPGGVIGNSASASVTPNKAGTYVFQLRVKEVTAEQLESDPSTVVVLVKGPPIPTVANLTVGSAKFGSVQVVANNSNPSESSTYEIIANPSHGEATISSNGLVTYKSNRNYVGADSYSVRVTNLSGLSGEVTGAINVVTSNLPPQPQAAAIQVVANQIATTQVLGNDPNEDQTLTYSIETQGTLGSASVNSSGLLTYSAAGVPGSDSVVVKVTDDGNPVLSANLQVNVTVLQENFSPAPTAPNIVVGFGGSTSVQIQANDPNPSQTHTYTLVSPTNLGTASVSPTGLVSFTGGTQEGNGAIVVLVTDNGSNPLSAALTIPVQVFDPAGAPVIGDLYFGQLTRGIPFGVVLFSDNLITTPTGTISSLRWSFGDGTSEKTSDPTANLLHNYTGPGTYTATLTATNSLGASASKSFTFTLVDTDIPTAKLTASSFAGTAPLTVNFDASASSDSDGILSYRWNWGTNPLPSADEATSNPTISHTFQDPGVYSVRLATIDQYGGLGISTVTIFVDVTPPLPVYPAIPDLALAMPGRKTVLGNSTTLDGTRSFNPNIAASVDQYWFRSGDYSCTSNCESLGVATSYTYNYGEVGNFFPSLQVAGSDGLFIFDFYQEVFVVNSGFAPKAVPYASVLEGPAPLTVNFTNESYDYDGTITNQIWFFGPESGCGENCSIESGTATYTFNDPGLNFVTLAVFDNDNNVHYNQVMVDVLPANAKKKAKTFSSPPSSDPSRADKKRALTGRCGKGDAVACFTLSEMYKEDGDLDLADKLKSRSCTLGHTPACTFKILRSKK